MPLGAARISFLAKTSITAVAEVIRKKLGVRVEGTAEIDTAQYKFGGASFVADGSGDDNLAIDQNAYDWTVFNNHSNSDNYTIECWIRVTSTSSHSAIFGTRTSSAPHNWDLEARSDTSFRWFNGNSQLYSSSTGAWSLNTWHHVAAVIEGANLNVYVDGTAVITQTRTDSNTTGGQDFFIGKGGYPTLNRFYGNIDEFRISDTARYTTSFTPDTEPFVNDDNTILLLHMDGTDGSTFFEDDNGVREQIGISAVNQAQIDTTYSQFSGTSLSLDGNDDILTVGDNDSQKFLDSFSNTSNWTVEYWVRPQSTSGFEQHFGNWGGSSTRCFFLGSDNGTQGVFYWVNSSGTIDTTTIGKNSGALTRNAWNHVALVKSGANFNYYTNGTRRANGAHDSIRAQAETTRIGASATNGEDLLGHMDEVRVSTVARYTGSSYTVPTEPFTNDSDTILLLHMNGTDGGTDFRDDNGKGRSAVGLSAEGNTQIDTAQSNFNGTSAVFDGTGDYLTTHGPDLGSGEWTIEMFVRFDSVAGVRVLYDDRESANTATGTILLYTNGTTLYFNSQQVNKISGGTLAINTWYHIAVTRDSSNDVRLFLDGTEIGTSYNDTSTFSQQDGDGFFGMNHQSPNNHYFDGYIDEVRFSDTARYTAGFTAPTETFQNDANTLLLLHMDGTDASTVFIDDNGTYPD